MHFCHLVNSLQQGPPFINTHQPHSAWWTGSLHLHTVNPTSIPILAFFIVPASSSTDNAFQLNVLLTEVNAGDLCFGIGIIILKHLSVLLLLQDVVVVLVISSSKKVIPPSRTCRPWRLCPTVSDHKLHCKHRCRPHPHNPGQCMDTHIRNGQWGDPPSTRTVTTAERRPYHRDVLVLNHANHLDRSVLLHVHGIAVAFLILWVQHQSDTVSMSNGWHEWEKSRYLLL